MNLSLIATQLFVGTESALGTTVLLRNISTTSSMAAPTTDSLNSLHAIVRGESPRTRPASQIPLSQQHIESLFARCRDTGKEYSLFRHENPYEPASYEIREGNECSTDSTTLGGEDYDPIEERFFGTQFVAHIHPPGCPPIPSERDLRIFAQRARLHPFTPQSHTVFGFVDGDPAFVHFTARLNRVANRVEFRFRTSSNIDPELISIAGQAAEEIAGEVDLSEAGRQAAAGRRSRDERDVFPIRLDFAPSAKPTEAEILKIVQAIVSQDHELYPNGDAGMMSVSRKYFSDRKYQIGDCEVSLQTLANWVRRARDLKTNDTKSLPGGQIIEEWKEELADLGNTVSKKERTGQIPITLDFALSANPTEAEILKIVQAIVSQDHELYPNGDAGRMSSSRKYTVDRWYQIGDREVTLGTLARWVRRARDLKANDAKSLPKSQIIKEWKEGLANLGVTVSRKERTGQIEIDLDFTPPQELTEEEILKIIQAIVSQHHEIYPNGDAGVMSTSRKYLRDYRYRISNREVTLATLARQFRRARGLRAHDMKSLPELEIIEEWKKGLANRGITVSRRESKVREVVSIALDFAPSQEPTEEEILKIVQAIVSQDHEFYPNGDAGGMSSGQKYIVDRWYQIGDREVTLGTLTLWVRRARGLKAGDTKSLPNSHIVEEWKEGLADLGNTVSKKERTGQIPITLDFTLSANPTEAEILKIVRAIVSQDYEFYPHGDARLMSTGEKYFKERWYQIGDSEVRLNTLAHWVRSARGLKANDTKFLPNSQIMEEWKRDLGVVDFSRTSPSDLQDFIQKNGLEEILPLFPDDPALLTEALTFLKGREFQNKDITEFVKAYVGLEVAGRRGTEGRPAATGSWERRCLYILAFLKALETGEASDLTEANFKRQLSLLIRLSRRDFEEAPSRLLEELETKADSSIHPFVQRLYAEVARHFRETRGFELKGVRTAAFAYQREGARFLATHDRAILADEAGMGKSYQVIAAAQSLGLKRVLWVTTAANKGTLREEILAHSFTEEDQIQIVISGNPRERAAQIEVLNGEKYVITNYETLVALQKSDPEGYRKLTGGLDVVIVDEAQMTDNPETLRTKAIHEIEAPRRWLATATPYQNRPASVWTLLNWLHPEKYPNRTAFKKMYCESSQGLLLLHSEMSEVMLRRTKRDTLSPFQPETEAPFEAQLAGGVPRIPKKVRVSPESSGRYDLSEEQADLIAWMTADFRDWAESFNANLPDGAEPVHLETINPLLKFGMIQKVIYEPEWFGLRSENPLFSNLDRVVAQRISRGEKVILWAWNTSVLDALERRYEGLGVRRMDGTVVGEERERARHDFQEDPGVRVLVANYQSGGAGLTLTAAHSAIFTQLPPQYPLLYQAEGRHHRLVGRGNLRHARERVEVEWMVPQFPTGFVEGLEDERLAEILSHGTLVEQTRTRLEGGETLYNLMMEGYGDAEALETYFKVGMIQSMGLAGDQRLDYTSHLKGETQTLAGVLKDLVPLWSLVEGHPEAPEAEDRVLQLVDALTHYPLLAARIGEAFRHPSQAYQDDLGFLLTLFQIGNKYVRQQLLERVPGLLVEVYGRGQSLAQAAQGLKIGRLTPAAFVAQIYLRSGGESEAVVGIARELSEQRDTPVRRYLEEHFFMGIFGILNQPVARALLSDQGTLFSTARLEDRIHAIYRLGILARTRPDLLEELDAGLEHAVHRAIGEFAGRPAESVEEMIRANPNWRGNADPVLALIAGWQEQNDAELLDQAREVLGHLLEGDYPVWRNGPNGREHGNAIDYLNDAPEFWDSFSRPHHTRIDRLVVSSQKTQASFTGDYLAVVEECLQEGEAVEGRWVLGEITAWRALSDAGEKRRILEDRQSEIRRLAQEMMSVSDFSERTVLKRRLEEVRSLVGWMVLDQGFEDQDSDRQLLIRGLDLKVKFYRTRHYDKIADHIETLKNRLVSGTQGQRVFQNLTVEDTDDPAILTRMGALHPEMTNCFNPNGKPVFHQFVVTALGSRNMRMLVVREGGKIVASAMMKVKQLEDGDPVLFLERGLYRKGYDFRREMLGHLEAKASQLSPETVVMDEARGRSEEGDTTVYGTGAFTRHEYVEPVFGLRRAANVKHAGRPFVSSSSSSSREDPAMSRSVGIGTSNKTIETYIKELRNHGVSVVVDVRGTPASRFYPHFNRDRLAASLKAAGIQYIWLGETLGNPKDRKGQRTLAGFQRHMKTESYRRGMTRLQEIIEGAPGPVAVTCSEGNEDECHRKFILADLKKRI